MHVFFFFFEFLLASPPQWCESVPQRSLVPNLPCAEYEVTAELAMFFA